MSDDKKKSEEEKKKSEDKDKKEGKYFYPNKWTRVVLVATEEVMGEKGMRALLTMGKLEHLIGNYPPNNMKKESEFEEVGRIQQAIWDMYGSRGARTFATRAGQEVFRQGLSEFKSVASAAQVAMRVASLEGKIKLGLEFFSKFFNAVSDQVVKIGEEDERFLWIIERCPVCWSRKTEEPCCHLAVGILQAAAGWVSEGKRFRIKEIECVATGGKTCTIAIEKEPVE